MSPTRISRVAASLLLSRFLATAKFFASLPRHVYAKGASESAGLASKTSPFLLACSYTYGYKLYPSISYMGITDTHRCRSRQIFGDAKDFCLNFPKLARKVFVQLLRTNFLTQRSRRPIFSMTSKKGLHVFSANFGRHF